MIRNVPSANTKGIVIETDIWGFYLAFLLFNWVTENTKHIISLAQ